MSMPTSSAPARRSSGRAPCPTQRAVARAAAQVIVGCGASATPATACSRTGRRTPQPPGPSMRGMTSPIEVAAAADGAHVAEARQRCVRPARAGARGEQGRDRGEAAEAHVPLLAAMRPKSGAAVSWPASMMPRRMARVRVK